MFNKNFAQKGMSIELVLLGVVLAISIFLLVFALTGSGQNKQVCISESELGVSGSVKPVNNAPVYLPKFIYNLTGSIKSLDKDAMIFLANVPVLKSDGQLSQRKDEKKALVSSETKISQLVIKDNPSGGNKILKETNISFKNLKVGAIVEVVGSIDIRDQSEFEARQIRVLPSFEY